MFATAIILLLLVCIFAGMPIAFALALCGSIGIGATIGFDGMVSKLSTTAYRSVADSTLASIPLFILMAELMNKGGMARDVFGAANRIVGFLPGGVAMASVLASAGFAAVSGSSTAASGTLAAISLPEFRKLGYSLPMATGVVAVAGTLAVMIPPSIAMIIYGIMTQTSIGKLLIAGVVPGVMTAAIYIVAIYAYAKLRPALLPRGEATTWREKASWSSSARCSSRCTRVSRRPPRPPPWRPGSPGSTSCCRGASPRPRPCRRWSTRCASRR